MGLLSGAFFLGRLKAKRINIKTLILLVILEGVGTLIYVGTHSIWAVIVGGAILGFAFGAVEPLMRTLIQALTPLPYVGRVMGSMQLVKNGGTLIPLLLAPMLSQQFGVQGVLIGSALLSLACGIILIPGARTLDAENKGTYSINHIDPFADGEEADPHEHHLTVLSESGNLIRDIKQI